MAFELVKRCLEQRFLILLLGNSLTFLPHDKLASFYPIQEHLLSVVIDLSQDTLIMGSRNTIYSNFGDCIQPLKPLSSW